MSTPHKNSEKFFAEILEKIQIIETRLNKIENKIHNIILSSSQEEHHIQESHLADYENQVYKINGILSERKIGEHVLAWLGNIVLLFGLTFMTEYIQKIGYPLLSIIIGYSAAAGVFGISVLIRRSFKNMAFMFYILSHLLIYYFTLRLHFYSETPLVENKTICLLLLITYNAIQLYLSVKQKSVILGGIALTLTIATGVLSNLPYFSLPVITASAIVAIIFLYRFKWQTLIIISEFLIYFSILFWLISNASANSSGNNIFLPVYGLSFLCANVVIYSMVTLIRKNNSVKNNFVLSSVLINGILFAVLLLLFILTFFENDYNLIFISIFLFCLGFSVILKFRSPWDFTPSFYAMFSFVSLSVAVYGFYKLPGAFLLLSIESLLVVTMALWFRSLNIVIMNLLLFLFLLITYLAISDYNNMINFSFAIVALVTPWILNSGKSYLDITKTYFLRHIYMFTAFLMILFSFYKAVPGQYVTLSWIGVALFYFLLSQMLRDKKYRWIAISTFIVSAFYLFIVDMARIELIYRVIAFLVFAIISLIISIIYSKRGKNLSK